MQQVPKKKIVIAAGGTGGHLFPAQALAYDLRQKDKDLDILFMSVNLSENPYFRKDEFKYKNIVSATPFRKNPFKLLKSFFTLLKGIYQSYRELGKYQSSLVLGFGSFHSFPIILAAKLKRTPIILFESNAFPGKVNKLCSSWAEFTALQFTCAAKYLKGKTACVHMPMLKKSHGISREQARLYYELDQDIFTFLVFGGSQGAYAINRFFCESLEKLLSKNFRFQVVHLTGNPERAERLKTIYEKYQIPASVKPFEDKMEFAWSAADLSISRAGAGTLAEQIEFSIPSILIPYPYASDHQTKNASFVAEEIQGSIALSEGELSSERLVSIIEDLLSSQNKKLKNMKKSLLNFKNIEQKKDFSALIFEFLNQ